jgi:flavodoxin short chain
MKTAVIYWSGTGNTEAMALAVAKGAKESGAEVDIKRVSEITPSQILGYDAVALGCPSMGAEILEENEMEPFVSELEKINGMKGKRLVLFGSYGWGAGEWMQDWNIRMKKAGFSLLQDGLIIKDTPDEEGKNLCIQLGKELTKK